MWIFGLISLLIAALATIVFVPRVIRIASAVGAVDHPGGRKHHAKPLPCLGGLAILAGLLAAVAASLLMRESGWLSDLPAGELLAFVVGTLIILGVGLVDDLMRVSALHKFLVQLVAASLVVSAGWSFQTLYLPLVGQIDLGLLAPLVSLLWIIGITNAINLMDGLDGLACGIVSIISASLMILAMVQGNPFVVLMTAAMTGACLGFLIFNWSPAKIFMGDSGALTLGFLLAVLSLQASLKASAAVAILVPVLALGLPAIDTLFVMMVRFLEGPHDPLSRRLARIFKADRQHVHHLVLSLAPKRRRVVISLYSIVLVFCLMALVVAVSRSFTLGVTLLLVEIGVVVLIRSAGLRAQARELALAGPGESYGVSYFMNHRADGAATPQVVREPELAKTAERRG